MYLDPAAGSMVLQVVAAAALSGVALFGRAREAVKAFFVAVLGGRKRSR